MIFLIMVKTIAKCVASIGVGYLIGTGLGELALRKTREKRIQVLHDTIDIQDSTIDKANEVIAMQKELISAQEKTINMMADALEAAGVELKSINDTN